MTIENTNEEVKVITQEEVDEKIKETILGSFIISTGLVVSGGALYAIGKIRGRHQSKVEQKKYTKGFKDAEKLIDKYQGRI